MYFSIPAVKDATWRHREVDVDSLRACGIVRRKSRISFESADLDVDDLDLDVPPVSGGGARGSGEDLFLSFMERCHQ